MALRLSWAAIGLIAGFFVASNLAVCAFADAKGAAKDALPVAMMAMSLVGGAIGYAHGARRQRLRDAVIEAGGRPSFEHHRPIGVLVGGLLGGCLGALIGRLATPGAGGDLLGRIGHGCEAAFNTGLGIVLGLVVGGLIGWVIGARVGDRAAQRFAGAHEDPEP